jgi:hypothetical protein
VTRGKHGRASRLVVAALFAATVLTLAGCRPAARHVGEEFGGKLSQKVRQVEDNELHKAPKDVGQELGEEFANEGAEAIEDNMDYDGDGVVNKFDEYPTDPRYHSDPLQHSDPRYHSERRYP